MKEEKKDAVFGLRIRDKEMEKRIRANFKRLKKMGFNIVGVVPLLLDKALEDFIKRNRGDV